MNVVVITGGSRGIGRAMVEEFARAGYAVAFTYSTNRETAAQLEDRLNDAGARVASYQADVRDFRRAREVIESVQQEFGPITTLINNAGIRCDGTLHRMTPESWNAVIETNLNGTFHYSRAVVNNLLRSGGAIINVTSVSGVIGIAGQTNYSASKAGVIGFTKALAREVARLGVRVNAIAPGYIDTDMTASMDENTRRKLYAQIPMGAPGTAMQVARTALYLAGDDAAYITGQVLTMDGGLS